MRRILEKKNKKYVIATLENPTRYLKSLTKGRYAFTEDIEIATKTLSAKIANMVLNDYYRDYGRDIEMVVVPIEIEFWFTDPEDE